METSRCTLCLSPQGSGQGTEMSLRARKVPGPLRGLLWPLLQCSVHAGRQRRLLPLGRSRRQRSPGARSSTAWRKGPSPGGPGGEASGNDPHFRCRWRSRSAKPDGFSTCPPPRAALQAAPQPLSSQLLLSPSPVTYISHVSHLQTQGVSFKNILSSSAGFDEEKM